MTAPRCKNRAARIHWRNVTSAVRRTRKRYSPGRCYPSFAMKRNTRRDFLKSAAATALVSAAVHPQQGQAQAPGTRFVDTNALRIGYEDSGSATGFPVILLHGFPDDVRAFDGVVPPLVAAGHRALVPYLRGYGPTRFREASAPRMAEQAAIGQDLVDFADALRLKQFAVVGYDWGGRAAA